MDGSNVAGSESKKRDFEESHEFGSKRAKIRDLEPVFRPEDIKHLGTKIECGSTCNLGSERDSMSVWKEMKQKGFLSSSFGGVPMPQMPKSRGKKKEGMNW